MHSTMDIKDFIREVYNASNIMTRPCYLSARGEVKITDAVQMCQSYDHQQYSRKGKNCYVIALKICQIFLLLFLLLGLYLNQGNGNNAPKNVCACRCICKTLAACIYDAV